MIHHAGAAPTRGRVIALPIAREPAAEARLVAVAPEVSALVFDAPEASGPLMAFVDGRRLDRPLVGTRLDLRTGGSRQVVLVGCGAEALRDQPVALVRGERIVAAIDPDWLQRADAERSALLEDLAENGALRLLRLLLTTGASLFRGGGPAFVELARRLLAALEMRPLTATHVCATGAAARLATWRVPTDLDPDRIGTFAALTSSRPVRLARLPIRLERTADGTRLHVELSRPLLAGSMLVATGGARLALAAPGPDAPVGIAEYLAGQAPGMIAFAQGLVESRMDRDPVAAAIGAELRQAIAPAPTVALRHASGTAAGLLYALALADPHGLVAAVRLTRGERSLDVPVGARLEGYVDLPRESRINDRFTFALVYRSGRLGPATAVALPRFDGAAPSDFADAAGLAAARLDLDPVGAPLKVDFFGTPRAPRVSLVTGLCEDLDFVRARAALVAAEPRGRSVEIVCHVSDRALATAARAALAHAAAAWGVPHRLVLMPAEASEADGLRAAIDTAAGSTVLVLGPKVLPSGPGWLPRLGRSRAAMHVARMIDHDGAPLAAEGAVVLDHATLARFGLAGYPAAHVVLAELAARLRTAGLRVRSDAATFVRYGAEPRTSVEVAADSHALGRLLKRSFNLGCEESGR